MNHSKNFNIELLRFVAILAVILIHMSMSHFYDSALMRTNFTAWFFNNIYYTATRFCVPIFFIITAYITFNSTTKKNWKQKIIRLGVPYLVWSYIYYLYSGGHGVMGFLKKIIGENTAFHLWFIPAFIGYTLLLPALKKIYSNGDKEKFRHLFFTIFSFSIVAPTFLLTSRLIEGDFKFLYGLHHFSMNLPAFLVYGFAFPYFYKKINFIKGTTLYLLLIFLNLYLNVKISTTFDTPDESLYGFTTTLVFISSYILFNTIMNIEFSFIPDFICSFIYKAGECAFGIYLSHWVIYLILDKNEMLVHNRAIVDPLINTAIVFTFTFILVLICRKIKPLRYIL